jgi:signal transduction histidine kinase/CheY-like chemotaxis protein
MKTAQIPADDEARLYTLHQYRILDTVDEQIFDDITQLAASICQTPIALVSLIDTNRQWFKSRHGLEALETPRDVSFCGHAIHGSEIFEVKDAFSDPRFSDNPLVTGGPMVRFYAGAPLVAPNGHALGTLCVIDHSPKSLSEEQKISLRALARHVTHLFEARSSNITLLENVIQHVPSAIVLKETKDFTYTLWNQNAEKIFKRPSSEVLGKTVYDLFPKEAADKHTYWDKQILKDGKLIDIPESDIALLGITDQFLRTRKVPILPDAQGKFRYILTVTEDVTVDKKLQMDLRHATQVAQNAVKSKSEFLANMSHEIRTPMNGVIGICNLLLGELKEPRYIEKLKIIRNCGNSLLDLINDILDFSKLEAKKIEIESEPFPIHNITRELIELLSTKASEKGLVISYVTSPSAPNWVKGDVTRFRQVLTNLVGNAIKFTDRGSVHISSTAEKAPNGQILMKFAIRDTGIGIHEDVRGKLFNIFSQGDASTTKRFGGTGLGLVISKELTEKMGGTITLESKVGEGSTFTFSILVAETQEKTLPAPPNPFLEFQSEVANIGPLRILVAEDNRINQLVAVGLLEKLGYQADVAANGSEVLENLQQQDYDLILMDCHMPIMDGFETTMRICEKYEMDRRPHIVALTASTMKADVDRCEASGMDSYLSKPVTIEGLVRVLKMIGNKNSETAQPQKLD